MIKPRTMPGVLELLPAEQITFQRMLDTIRSQFELFGFLPIETPVMELSEVLLTKSGGETEREVYFAQTTGSREQGKLPELALRFDLTVPFARYVAEHENELSFPFRRYQIQRVYRGERPQKGRFREFYQCDIDVIARESLSLRYDAEIPAVMERVFDRLGIGEFTIRLNNRKLMRGLLDDLGVTDDEAKTLVLREVDKLDKRGAEAVSESLAGLGMSEEAVRRLVVVVQTRSTDHATALTALDGLAGGGATFTEGVAELREVLETMRSLGVPEHRYALDLSIARGLDYYTGTVYETTLDEHPEIGSICSGGRYDDLAGHYTSSRLPGVGMSIGLTRLFWQLREIGLVSASTSTVTALVTLMDAEAIDYTLDIATRLRAGGINTEAVVEASKLGKQLKAADRAGIRFTVIAGSDERERGTATVKDLITQTQAEVAIESIVDHLRSSQEN
jgi:histidyl-tRNA synthetase